MSFNRLKKWFGAKKEEPLDVFTQITQMAMESLNDRQKLLRLMGEHFQRKFFSTMVGLTCDQKSKAQKILDVFCHEKTVSEILNELQNTEIEPGTFFIWSVGGSLRLNDVEAEYSIVFRQMSTAWIITFLSDSQPLIAMIDSCVVKHSPELNEISQESVAGQVFYLTGVDSNRNEVPGLVEKQKISSEILVEWWNLAVNPGQKYCIIKLVESCVCRDARTVSLRN